MVWLLMLVRTRVDELVWLLTLTLELPPSVILTEKFLPSTVVVPVSGSWWTWASPVVVTLLFFVPVTVVVDELLELTLV